jgi:hypothetical protein
MKLLGLVVALALSSSRARADVPLARGVAWSAGAAAGASVSSFSIAPAVGETASLGVYVHSSETSALALEAVEAVNLVIDRTTPQYGLVGIGLRHLGRPDDPLIGPRGTVSLQRFALGPAFLGDGERLDLGLSAAFSVAYLTSGRGGFSLDVEGYVFDSSNVGTSSLVLVGLGYVVSPRNDVPRRAPPVWQPPATPPPASVEPDLLAGPCRDPSEYTTALQAHRKRYVEACANHEPGCETERATIEAIDAKLKACTAPKDDDANP